jgi:hypothetical protein
VSGHDDQTVTRIADEVRAMAAMGLPALRAVWRSRWGEPPAFRSRDLLARAMAYRLQAQTFGGPPVSLRRRLEDYGQRFAADRTFTPAPGPALKPGSSLIREWRGVRHEVAVTERGFAYQGESFRSLSQVALRITGTKWNGHVFFGLKGRPARSA